MKAIWSYWCHVGRLAWQESAAALKKEAWKLILGLVATVGLAYFSPGLLDLGRLLLAALVPALAIGGFLWKFVSIPARLHKRSLVRADYRKIAEALERQHSGGEALRSELNSMTYTVVRTSGSLYVNVAANPLNINISEWCERCVVWFRQTAQMLQEYDDAEAFMFRSIEPELIQHGVPVQLQFQAGEELKRLNSRLEKLRKIIGRAFEYASDHPRQQT